MKTTVVVEVEHDRPVSESAMMDFIDYLLDEPEVAVRAVDGKMTGVKVRAISVSPAESGKE